jgi:flagellar protein FlaJ
MGVMMVLMGSGNDMMLYAIIYAVIPIGSVVFVVMINMLSPSASGTPALLSTRAKIHHEVVMPHELVHLKVDKNAPVDPKIERLLGLKKMWAQFIKSKKTLAVRQTLKDPLKSVKLQPANILLVSAPAALIVVAVAYMTHRHELLSFNLAVNFLDDYLVYALYISLVPLAFFHEKKMMHERKLQKQIPDFLGRMASTNETGMTIRDSIKLMAKSDTGAISKQIKLVWKDIDCGEVLSVAARDAETEQTLRKERAMNMMIYIVIIYISFLVFVGVIYVITDSFLAQMATAGEEMAASGTAGGGGFLGAFDLDAYKRMFFHASLIQGFCSGLIAGVMGEGSVLSGLKHSIVMMTVALLIFKLVVGGV